LRPASWRSTCCRAPPDPSVWLILFGTATPPTFFFRPLNFVAAAGERTISSSTLTPGTHLFICVIHPWMQETVVVH
jgi:hypothetical protein